MLARVAIVLLILSAGLAMPDKSKTKKDKGTPCLSLDKDSHRVTITCGVVDFEKCQLTDRSCGLLPSQTDDSSYDGECTIGCNVQWQQNKKTPGYATINITLTQPCTSVSSFNTVTPITTTTVPPHSSEPASTTNITAFNTPHCSELAFTTTKTVTPNCSEPVPTITMIATQVTTKTETPSCSEPASTTHIQCSSAITTSTLTPSCTQVPSTIIYHATETVTVSTDSSRSPSKAFSNTCRGSTAVTPLGVLLGLMIAIVVVIIIGWVYTCWRARNNGKTNAPFKTRRSKIQTTHDDEERLFENPTYDRTTSTEQQQGRQAQQQQRFPGVTYAIYDTVTTPSQRETQNGETYNVLERGKESGAVGRSAARRVVSSNQDMSYSLLGLPDKDVKHNYHVVEQH